MSINPRAWHAYESRCRLSTGSTEERSVNLKKQTSWKTRLETKLGKDGQDSEGRVFKVKTSI